MKKIFFLINNANESFDTILSIIDVEEKEKLAV